MVQDRDFRSVSIRAGLIDEVEGLIEKSGRYRSIADFVSESIRRRLEELGENQKERARA